MPRDYYTVPGRQLTNGDTFIIGSAVYPDSTQFEQTTLGELATFLNVQPGPPTPGGTGIIQVGTDKRLYDQNGNRLYIRGVHAFNHCFAVFDDGYRFDWQIRFSQTQPVGTVSPPIPRGSSLGTWLSYAYVNDATARQYIAYLKGYGFNCIRLWVGAGMIKTAPFTDAVTGLSFPSELVLLDNIVKFCADFGMYTWMTFAQGSVPDDETANFWAILADRYKNASNVVLDIQNEPASGTVFVTPTDVHLRTPYVDIMPSLAQWQTRFRASLAAIRDTGFLGPVGCAPYHNLWSLDTVQAALNNPPFSTDPNLIAIIHIYYIFGDTATTFAQERPILNAHAYNFTKYYCVVCAEFGATNDFPFADSTASIAYNKEALGWLQQEGFNGQINFTMQPQHDDLNDLFDNTTQFVVPGAPTDFWGQHVIDYNLNAAQGLAQLIPNITSTAGPLTDTAGTQITFRRVGMRVDLNLYITIVTNGTAAGTLLALLPSNAPSDNYQTFTGVSSAGTIVLVKLLGLYAEITNLDGTYPGADGVTITASLTYYAESDVTFTYKDQLFDGSYRYLRNANITGLANGKQGTVITTLDMRGLIGDGSTMRIFTTNNAHWTLFRNSNNKLQLQLRNAANDLIGQIFSTIDTSTHSPEHTVFISWDLSVPVIKMYIKGVDRGDPATLIAIDDDIDYNDTNFSIGALVSGNDQVLRTNMKFFWFHNIYMEPGNYINNGAFFDQFDVPIELGHYGDALIGQLPLIFMRNLTPGTDFALNHGTGGGFTKTVSNQPPNVRISYGQSWSSNAFPTFGSFGFDTQAGLLVALHVPVDLNGNPGLLPNSAGMNLPSVPDGVGSYLPGYSFSIGRCSVLAQNLLQARDNAPTILPIIEFCAAYQGSTWLTGPGGGLQPGGTSWTNMLTIINSIETLLPLGHLQAAVFKDVVYTQGGSGTGHDTVADKLSDLTAMLTDYDALALPGAGLDFFLGIAAPNSDDQTLHASWWGTYQFCRDNAPGRGGPWSGRCWGTTPWYQWPFSGPTDPAYGDIHTGPYGTAREGEVVGYVAWLVQDKGIDWTPLWRSFTAPITRSGNTFIVPFDRPAGPDFAAGVMSWQNNADDGIKDWPQYGWHVKRGGVEMPLFALPVISGMNVILDIGTPALVGDEVSYAYYGPGGPAPGLCSGVGGNLVMQGPPSVLFPDGYHTVPKTIDAWAWPFVETVAV